jgi:hypothetical protein
MNKISIFIKIFGIPITLFFIAQYLFFLPVYTMYYYSSSLNSTIDYNGTGFGIFEIPSTNVFQEGNYYFAWFLFIVQLILVIIMLLNIYKYNLFIKFSSYEEAEEYYFDQSIEKQLRRIHKKYQKEIDKLDKKLRIKD